MSTTAKISIRLKPEYKGLVKFHVKEWRDHPERGYYDTECCLLVNDNIMSVWISYDGYIKGVGERLFRGIRTYQEAYEFILHGNRSGFDTPLYEANVPWERHKPIMLSSLPDNSTPFDYYYIWDELDGEWQWMVRKYSEVEYMPLKCFFPGMDFSIQRTTPCASPPTHAPSGPWV